MAHTLAIVDGKTQNDVDFYNLLNALADGNSFFAGPTDYKVTQSGTPGMSVVVTLGKGFHYIGSKTSYFQSYLDTNTTLSVPSNASGSTRIDIVCVKFDTGVASDAAGDNVVTLQYVTGTPGSGVPATPANYTKMAEVSVANGAVSIVDANITNKRNFLTLVEGATQFVQIPTPSAPPAGANKVYFKTDGNIYTQDSSGNEKCIAVTGISGFSVSTSTNQTIAASTPTKIAMDTAVYDLGTEFDITTNHRFTAAKTGKYLFTFTGHILSLASGKELTISIYVNGVEAVHTFAQSAGDGDTAGSLTAMLSLTATQYVEFFVTHDDTVSRNMQGNGVNTFAMGQRLV